MVAGNILLPRVQARKFLCRRFGNKKTDLIFTKSVFIFQIVCSIVPMAEL
jgi:hypothetical protein